MGRFELATAPHATFGVANVHLDHLDVANRRRSAVLLVDWLDPGLPWVVMGDFNERRDAGARPRVREGRFVSVLPPESPGTFHRFTKRCDGATIDDILVRGPWTVRDNVGCRPISPAVPPAITGPSTQTSTSRADQARTTNGRNPCAIWRADAPDVSAPDLFDVLKIATGLSLVRR